MTDKDKVKQMFEERGVILLHGKEIHWPVLTFKRILKEALSVEVEVELLMRYSTSKILQVVFADGSILLITSYHSIHNDSLNLWVTTSEDIENICRKMVVMFSLTSKQIFDIKRLAEELKHDLLVS